MALDNATYQRLKREKMQKEIVLRMIDMVVSMQEQDSSASRALNDPTVLKGYLEGIAALSVREVMQEFEHA